MTDTNVKPLTNNEIEELRRSSFPQRGESDFAVICMSPKIGMDRIVATIDALRAELAAVTKERDALAIVFFAVTQHHDWRKAAEMADLGKAFINHHGDPDIEPNELCNLLWSRGFHALREREKGG